MIDKSTSVETLVQGEQDARYGKQESWAEGRARVLTGLCKEGCRSEGKRSLAGRLYGRTKGRRTMYPVKFGDLACYRSQAKPLECWFSCMLAEPKTQGTYRQPNEVSTAVKTYN